MTLPGSRSRAALELVEEAQIFTEERIHDGFIQHVVGAQMWMQSVRDGLSTEDARLAADTVVASLEDAVNEARSMMADLSPFHDSSFGHVSWGVRQLGDMTLRRQGLRVEIEEVGEPVSWSPPVAAAICRIVQLALLPFEWSEPPASVLVRIVRQSVSQLVEVRSHPASAAPAATAKPTTRHAGARRKKLMALWATALGADLKLAESIDDPLCEIQLICPLETNEVPS